MFKKVDVDITHTQPDIKRNLEDHNGKNLGSYYSSQISKIPYLGCKDIRFFQIWHLVRRYRRFLILPLMLLVIQM